MADSPALNPGSKDICTRVQEFAGREPGRLFCRLLKSGSIQEITYGELFATASRYAAAYLERGVRKGDVVLIIFRHGPELFPSFLGAMLIGALPSFLPFLTPRQKPDLYWAAHRAVFARTGARLLVTWGDNLESMRQAMPDFTLPVHLVEDTPHHGDVPAAPAWDFAGPAFLQHSSGTTGLKKGVVITHRALCAQVDAYAKSLALTANDRIATWLPLYHDMGLVSCFLLPLMSGVPVVAMDPFEWVVKPTTLLDAIKAHQCTLAWLPNFAFHHICSALPKGRRWDLTSLKALIDCSEPCKAGTLRLFAEKFAGMGVDLNKLQICYALAENVFAATQTQLGAPAQVLYVSRRVMQAEQRIEIVEPGADTLEFVSAGHAIEGVQIRVRDGAKDLPEDRVGEITLGGACVFDGYYKNDAETAERLENGWYRTRDLGFIHEGELYVTGRVDDLLIVHGVNYYAHDIEFAANQVAGVIGGRCVAIGEYRVDAGTTEVVVLAETEPGAANDSTEIKRVIKLEILSQTGLLVQQVGIVPQGWLIKTTSGKISRSENLKRFRELVKDKP